MAEKMSNYERHSRMIESNKPLQYEEAVKAYRQKKEDMRRVIAASLKQQLAQEVRGEAEKHADEIMNLIVGNGWADSTVMRQGAEAQLAQVRSIAELQASAQVNKTIQQNIRSMATEVVEAIDDYNNSHKQKIKDMQSSFFTRLNTKMKNGGLEALMSKENILTKLKLTEGTTKEVQDQLVSYYKRIFLSNVLGGTKQWLFTEGTSMYIEALRGYYGESAKADAISQAFKDYSSQLLKFQPKKSFAENIGGQGGKVDIKFDVLMGLDYQKNFVGKAKAENMTDEVKKLIKAAGEEYGAQSKSFLPSSDEKQGWIKPVLQIGHNSQLLAEFKNSKRSYPTNHQPSSMVFLGSDKENILNALGKDNVIMIDAKNAYWMEDFIKRFRAAKYYLTFDYTKQENKKYLPTTEIILYAWTRSKSHKALSQKRKS